MAIHGYHSEMGETCPAQVTTHATLSHYGRHYFLRSTLGPDVLKGVGIVYEGVLTAERLVPGSKFVGMHEYKVTTRAMDKLKKSVEIGLEMLLD
jgi:hypothetical protein